MPGVPGGHYSGLAQWPVIAGAASAALCAPPQFQATVSSVESSFRPVFNMVNLLPDGKLMLSWRCLSADLCRLVVVFWLPDSQLDLLVLSR